MSTKQYPTKNAVTTKLSEEQAALAPTGEQTTATQIVNAEAAASPRIAPVEKEIATGGVVASSTTLVGKASTAEEIKVVAAQKESTIPAPLFSPAAAALIQKLSDAGNQPALNVLQSLHEYMEAMAPGKLVTDAVGGRHQAKLYRLMETAINTVEADFPILFAAILRIADDHSEGVFNARYLFRFLKDMTLNPDERQAFQRIMNLITTAAPVAGRAEAVRFVDFTRTLEFRFNDAGRQRVLAFFNK